MKLEIERFEAPMPQEVVDECFAFWEPFFDRNVEDFRDVYTGKERAYNRDLLYFGRKGGRLVGVAHLTISASEADIGGVGAVATDPDFRRQGIAQHICESLRDDFFAQGGQALFLATSLPTAFRVYRRAGWEPCPSAHVMCCTADRRSPEEFLAHRFESGGPLALEPADPGIRYPMVPLIVCPHNWQVLDANTGILSTRYAVQKSCGGLYPKYEPFVNGPCVTAIAARAGDGCLVGLFTARIDQSETCHVDGFLPESFGDHWPQAMQTILEWGTGGGAADFRAELSVEDSGKIALLESMGFRRHAAGAGFELAERRVASTILRRGVSPNISRNP